MIDSFEKPFKYVWQIAESFNRYRGPDLVTPCKVVCSGKRPVSKPFIVVFGPEMARSRIEMSIVRIGI